METFLNGGCFLSDDFSMCRVDIKQASTFEQHSMSQKWKDQQLSSLSSFLIAAPSSTIMGKRAEVRGKSTNTMLLLGDNSIRSADSLSPETINPQGLEQVLVLSHREC